MSLGDSEVLLNAQSGNQIQISENGIVWNCFRVDVPGSTDFGVVSACAHNGTVVAVGFDGLILQSSLAGTRSFLPAFSTTPSSRSARPGESATFTVAARGSNLNYRWHRNGVQISTTGSELTLSDVQPTDAGVYHATITSSGGASVTSASAILGVASTAKVIGTGRELEPRNIRHPNGNTFDQILLEGAAAAITADHTENQITRMSYIDLDDDIVQIEFSGPGTLSLVLDNATTPAAPLNYHQPGVAYVKGHAGIVITGADERTNVSVFTVGRATAFDPTGRFNLAQGISATNDPANNGSSLFAGHAATDYDGIADLAFIAISSTNGKFGGVRTSNANYFASRGLTGIYAPDVAFQGPVFIGNINAFDSATPTIMLGSAGDTRITGGDMLQNNRRAVDVSGITRLRFTPGSDSHGHSLPAEINRAVYRNNGTDVTTQIVVNPAP